MYRNRTSYVWYLLVDKLQQLSFFLYMHSCEILNHNDHMKVETFRCDCTATCETILDSRFWLQNCAENMIILIHQSPSSCKPHQHRVCPTDLHKPSPKCCYGKLAPVLLGVIFLPLNVLLGMEICMEKKTYSHLWWEESNVDNHVISGYMQGNIFFVKSI